MKPLKLSQNDLEYVKLLIDKDIPESATDVFFFDEMKIEPKDYIDQMIAIAKMFEMDFWEVIGRNCSDFESKRLHVLYDGQPLRKIIAINKRKKTKQMNR